MILDHSNIALEIKDNEDKGNLLQEILTIAMLIELLRKDVLLIMANYIKHFSEQEVFDFKIPISYIDINHFITNNYSLIEELKIDQLIFNLQLFSIKLYSLFETDKKFLKNLQLKKLRLSFAHRKSPFILSGKEKVMVLGGLSYDLNYFEIMNIGYKDDGVKNEIIPFYYGNYIETLTEYTEHNLVNNVKQLRELNKGLIVPVK